MAGGPFMWSQHAQVKVLGVDLEAGVVDARHDGYQRLAGGVVHRRWLIAPPNDRTQLVVDLITGMEQHTCLQNWPLHPSLAVEPLPSGHILIRGDLPVMQLLYAASAHFTHQGVRGDEEMNLGGGPIRCRVAHRHGG